MKLSLLVSSLERLLCEYSGSPYSMRKSCPMDNDFLLAGTQIILVALGLFLPLCASLALQGTHTAEFCVMPYSAGLLMSLSVFPIAIFC